MVIHFDDEGNITSLLGFAVRMRSTGAHVLVLLEYDWRRGGMPMDLLGQLNADHALDRFKWIENDHFVFDGGGG